jgi:hypothetical protein
MAGAAMRNWSRQKIMKTEDDMQEAVAHHLANYAAREVNVGGCIFDVVAYNEKTKSFGVVECKPRRKISGIGKAFGQLAAYSAIISTQGRKFIAHIHRHLPRVLDLLDAVRSLESRRPKRGCSRRGLEKPERVS